MSGNWLLRFAGRNDSDTSNLNFLWKKDNIYIMDNHLAALWCWLQEINPHDKYKLLHIDSHYDAANDAAKMPSLKLDHLFGITLEEYRLLSYSDSTGREHPLFWHDNYMWPLFPGNGSPVSEFIFAAHNDKHAPRFDKYDKIPPCELLQLCPRFAYSKDNWIVNVDLDYFFHDFCCRSGRRYIRLFSYQYIERVFSSLKYHHQNGRIAVLTIALSPEFCGGWNEAEQLCQAVCAIMDIPFNLPPQ